MAQDRRARQREAMLAEIRTTARTLLVDKGGEAVTVNAVAREMGLSGPAIYRYYSGHDELVGAVTADFYAELTAVIDAARAGVPAAEHRARLFAMCRAMRAWAITHRPEFGWMFARPVNAADLDRDSLRQTVGRDFERPFFEETAAIWETAPFPVPALADLDPSLRRQLRANAAAMGGRLPPEAVHVFLGLWIRLYGLLCMEVLHQLDFAFTDAEPLFEECLEEAAHRLGL
ncbi:TetR/AcrR family transcriptional regulator [Phytomonospora endophytica]|uniref:AcrR family transcriptional regulator n=1 Tax=Phytomonospora endophytica TaxID=714109 RepID=A0A841FSL5_9ACTN|nr:WHG domain-containing protein [Phytomonospora endophytica]MBB6036748.1 AcrR family transcriptional regulator [Phytomonospora endophytica]GIG68218.1 TetR family transcriptional regulator [Phytomonospora endophytica]